jgi:predicted nucleic acid-binding protein
MLEGRGVTHGADTSFLLAIEIVEHAHHIEALRLLGELLARGDRVAIAPQVLTEFVHVVTDARRFQKPFSTDSGKTGKIRNLESGCAPARLSRASLMSSSRRPITVCR